MFKKVVAIFTTMVLLIALTVVSCAENTNYIFNGSFELLIDGEPSNWMREAYDKSPGASKFRVETEGAKFGEKYVTIINNKLNDSRYSQIVLVEENKKYKLSCYIKTENVSEEGKGANLSVAEQTVTSKRIKGTTDDWEYVELYVITESGVDRIKVTVGLGGYSGMSTGKASFDNVTMEEVETIPEGAPRAVVKAQNTKKSSNNSNNTNNTKSSSSQNNENKNELGKVVLVMLIVGAIAVGVAVYNTFRSNKKVSGNQGNASNNTGTNTNMTESAANKESAGNKEFSDNNESSHSKEDSSDNSDSDNKESSD